MNALSGYLRKPFLLIIVGSVVAVFLVWWFALESPQGSKLSSLQTQQVTLQSNVDRLQAELAQLKIETRQIPAELQTLQCDQLALPATQDEPGILNALNGLESQTGAGVANFALGPPQALSSTQSSSSKKTSTPSTAIQVSTVTLTVAGTYGQVTAFLTGIYHLPRLFVINSFALGGSLQPQAPTYSVQLSAQVFNVSGGNATPASTSTTVGACPPPTPGL